MSCSLDVELDAPGDAVVIIRDTDVGMTPEELTAAVQPVAQFTSIVSNSVATPASDCHL